MWLQEINSFWVFVGLLFAAVGTGVLLHAMYPSEWGDHGSVVVGIVFFPVVLPVLIGILFHRGVSATTARPPVKPDAADHAEPVESP